METASGAGEDAPVYSTSGAFLSDKQSQRIRLHAKSDLAIRTGRVLDSKGTAQSALTWPTRGLRQWPLQATPTQSQCWGLS